MKKALSYEQYRPNYPTSLIDKMLKDGILKEKNIIAEFGIGTGKLTDLLLKEKNFIYGIEPDKENYEFLIQKYQGKENLQLLPYTAEQSRIESNTIDIVIAAQSFHMFEIQKAKNEFYRILKPNGIIILIWYYWDMKYPISSKIRNLFYKYGKSENQKKRVQINDRLINNLFYPNEIKLEKIDTIKQIFSREDFINSMLTSSYATLINDSNKLVDYTKEANSLFKEFSFNGFVEYSFNLLMYHTKITIKQKQHD